MGGAHAQLLLTILVVLVCARAAGWLAARLGQPRVCGEIAAGIVLGPSLVGSLWPQLGSALYPASTTASLQVLGEIGLILFMFLVGAELDLSLLRGQGRRAIAISQVSILVPLGLGSALGTWLHPRLGGDVPRLGFVLFLGAAMAITAFPVLLRILHETGLLHRRVGVLAIASAAVDDVTAWCVLSAVVAVVRSSGAATTLRTICLAVAFVAVVFGVVRPWLARRAEIPLWLAVPLALACAWATELIGIHALFGAFLAGTALPRRPGVRADLDARLSEVTSVLLLPVFFVTVGLATRLDQLDSADLWGLTALIVATAVVGKLGAAALTSRLVGERGRDALAIGVLMNTRGLTEVVILTVGLELGVIDTTLFTMMVVMALTTTVMARPLLALLQRPVAAPAAAPVSSPAPATRSAG